MFLVFWRMWVGRGLDMTVLRVSIAFSITSTCCGCFFRIVVLGVGVMVVLFVAVVS